MAEEAFTYTTELAKTGETAQQSGGFVTDWFLKCSPARSISIGVRPMKNIAKPPELFKVFAIEEQASAKVTKPGAQAAAAGAPGGTFKI